MQLDPLASCVPLQESRMIYAMLYVIYCVEPKTPYPRGFPGNDNIGDVNLLLLILMLSKLLFFVAFEREVELFVVASNHKPLLDRARFS